MFDIPSYTLYFHCKLYFSYDIISWKAGYLQMTTKVYKRTIWMFLSSFIGSIVGAAAIGFITYLFTEDLRIIIGITLVILGLSMLLTLFGENIRFELDVNELKYFKNNKLKNTFKLNNISIAYETETGRKKATTITLTVYEHSTNQSVNIDCAPLGLTQFYRMFEEIEPQTIKNNKEQSL